MSASISAEEESAPFPAGGVTRPIGQRFPSSGPPEAPELFVTAQRLEGLRARRDGLRRQIADARRATGDQVAEAALGVDQEIEYLSQSYPIRVQHSFHWDPEISPLTPPFWAYGLWHDTDNTFVRLLAPNPLFRDEEFDIEIEPVQMDQFLYRLPGIIDHGSVSVGSSRGYVRAFWHRREEVERR